MNLFGKKKTQAAPKLSDSIQSLRKASEMLDKRQNHLDKQIAQATAEAKAKMKNKDKKGALFLLKRKKMYEKQVEQIYGKKANIETQIIALENAGINGDVAAAMQTGERALRSTLAKHNIDDVEEAMEQITETMDQADELSNALSNPIGPIMDEDELEDELGELEAELTEEAFSTVEAPANPNRVAAQRAAVPLNLDSAPAVPSQAPSAPPADKNEEAALKELEEMMGM